MKYVIILEPGENNWGAFSPDVPGCVSTGLTPQETISNFLEALELHLDSLGQQGEPIPPEHVYDEADYADNSDYVRYRWAPVPATADSPPVAPAV